MTANVGVNKELESLRRLVDQTIAEKPNIEWGDGFSVYNNLLYGVIQIADLAISLELGEMPDFNKQVTYFDDGFRVTGSDASIFTLNFGKRESSGEVSILFRAKDLESIKYHLFMNPREFLQSNVEGLGKVYGVNEISKPGTNGASARNMFEFIGAPIKDNESSLPARFKNMLTIGRSI